MASESKNAANRRNAQKSTGPRSVVGKARSSRNAFRHGLAIPITRDIFNADVIELLVRQLMDKAAPLAEQEHAQLAAEAEAEILRARQVKADLLNRAAHPNLADGEIQMPDEVMALAFAATIETLSAFEHYERRALSKRNRALRALTASQRANDTQKRKINVFLESVERLDITTVVKAAFAHPPRPRYSELAGWSGATYGITLDLRSASLVRADAFIQCYDGASGRLQIRMTYEDHKSITQTYAIATRSIGVTGTRWVAICPTTGLAVASLFLPAGQREMKSRHAVNLNYRSRQHRAGQGRERKRRPENVSSQGESIVEYAEIVAAITEQAKPHLSVDSGITPTLPQAANEDIFRGGRWLARQPAFAQPNAKPRQRSGIFARQNRDSNDRRPPWVHHHVSADPECDEAGSRSEQRHEFDHQLTGDSPPMAAHPTAPGALDPTTGIDTGPLRIEALSIPLDRNDLKTGEMLAAEGKLEEALTVYQHYAAICRAKIANRSSIRATEELERTVRRIGGLTFGFLLMGSLEQALICAHEGLTAHPDSVVLNINLAHALMLLGRVAEAQAIYQRYRGKKMPPRGKPCDDFILQGLVQLRLAGLSHPLMEEIEQGFVINKETDQQSAENTKLVAKIMGPAVNNDQRQTADTRLAETVLGDQLAHEGKLADALVSYRRGLASCKRKLMEDDASSQAQHDLDLVVTAVGNLAFKFLLIGSAKPALELAEEALSYRPAWVGLHGIRAFALMCSANVTGARKIFEGYRGAKVNEVTTWEDFVRFGFDLLRKAGRKYSLMDYMEKQFGSDR